MADEQTVGIVVLGLTSAGAVMSMFLPSPSTAYDKASGCIASGPESIALLKRGEIIGSVISLAIAGAASLLAAGDLGPNAAWIFIGALAVVGIFIWEYESAFKKGQAAARAGEAA